MAQAVTCFDSGFLFDSDLRAEAQPEALRRARAIDSNFQKAAGADDGYQSAATNRLISGGNGAHSLATHKNGRPAFERTQDFGGNIGNGVAESVDIDHLSPDSFAGASWFRPRQADQIPATGSQLAKRHAIAQVSGHWSEDVASMKRATHPGQKITAIFERVDGFDFLPGQRPGEQTVIRSDEKIIGRLNRNGAAFGANARIDNGNVDGVPGKKRVACGESESARADISRSNFVGKINDPGPRRQAQDNPLHRAHEPIASTEVSGEGNATHRQELTE